MSSISIITEHLKIHFKVLTKKITSNLLSNRNLKYDGNQDLSSLQEVTSKMKLFFENGMLKNRQKIVNHLKERSDGTVKVWVQQCECVFAQRLRRGQQMFSLYSHLWEENAFKQLLACMRQRLMRHGKSLMFSAIGVSVFDWDANRISLDEMKSHMNEVDYLKQLISVTFNHNPSCGDKTEEKSDYWCELEYHDEAVDGWTLFINQSDLIVWRKKHPSGSFEYKLYGSYNDVTAEDFLNVQVDIQYRREWDHTAVALDLVDVDPDKEVYGDVVYWEMLWPKLFTNRDYVFNRRYMVDCEEKVAVIMSKSTQHPSCPVKEDKFRVNDYWSYMVIKPYTELDKPGIEFGLTYFDNPGVNIPSAITSWVAMKAMPDFLSRLREATKLYSKYCEKTNTRCVCIVKSKKETEREPVNKNQYTDLGPGLEVMTSPSLIVQSDVKGHHFLRQFLQFNAFS